MEIQIAYCFRLISGTFNCHRTVRMIVADQGIEQKANWLREEFLTGTAIAVIIALLILLVNPKNVNSRAIGFTRRCPVCDKRLIGNVNYCGECGSKV
jgi:hypothetical protein